MVYRMQFKIELYHYLFIAVAPVGIGVTSLIVFIAIISVIVHCYRRHQRKITFKSFTSRSGTRTTSSLPRNPLPSIYDLQVSTDFSTNHRTENCSNENHENESSSRLGENTEICFDNQYIDCASSERLSSFEPYATIHVDDAGKATPKTAVKNTLNQLYAKPLPHNKRHGEQSVRHDVMSRRNCVKLEPNGTNSHHHHVQLTTIKENVSSIEKKARRKVSNARGKTSSFKPPVPAKTTVCDVTDSRADGERDSGFSDASQSNGHSSKPAPENVKAAFVSELTKMHKKRHAPEPRAYPLDVSASHVNGPNNLKQFHVRKPSKRHMNTAAQSTHVEHDSKTQAQLDRKPARAPAPATPVVYSHIDFAHRKPDVLTKTNRGSHDGATSQHKLASSSSTESLNTTWSQSADEQEVTADANMAATECRQTDGKYHYRYKKAVSKEGTSTTIAPVQKKTRRSRSKHTKQDAAADSQEHSTDADRKKAGTSSAADEDVTIQIQLKMLNNHTLGSKISLANQSAATASHGADSSPDLSIKHSRHSDSLTTNRKRSGSLKSTRKATTSSKPAPRRRSAVFSAWSWPISYRTGWTSASASVRH